ncbi:helix-turn-helix domain-containing protein [Microbacterium esteraromaticum]|uniref:helix-turn-helix domain-containing protein n=1 Tax=Microbacterium esteraromaticum TaxID=57043 RepID=UPI000B34FBD7|nr:AraC family transcriptional regulator [Microbacterium esteraromaticum]
MAHERRPLRILHAHHSAAVEPIAFPQAKVVVVTAGWTKLEHRGQVTPLTEGDVAILPAQALVAGVPLPVAETVTFYLDPPFLEQQLAWTRTVAPLATTLHAAAAGTGPILSLRPTTTERRTIIKQARTLAACDASSARVSLELLGACLSFLARIEHVISPPSYVLPRSDVRAVVAALRGDLARRWAVSDLSRIASLSMSQLTRSFNSSLGSPPMQVLARLRVERLAELLLTTDWTVQRCAEAVGWFDPCYATRIMKRLYGITPSEYRKTARCRRWLGSEFRG